MVLAEQKQSSGQESRYSIAEKHFVKKILFKNGRIEDNKQNILMIWTRIPYLQNMKQEGRQGPQP